MDNKVALEVALTNINSTSKILSDNPSFEIINSNLSAVRLILESQLAKTESTVTVTTPTAVTTPVPAPLPNVDTRVTSLESEDYDAPTRSQSTISINTYRVEEETTAGWTVVDARETVKLTKEEAQEKIDALIRTQGYAPDRIRVVVDGQR